ncbi:hypothetical protein VTI74DRAFT_2226 [Chaetomium olivicolor]
MRVSNGTTVSNLHAFEWDPADLIRPRPGSHSESVAESPSQTLNQTVGFALIVLNQPLHKDLTLVRRLWDNASIRVAADGGANCLFQAAGSHGNPLFDNLDLIIGDLDSISTEARAYYEFPPPSSARRIQTQIVRDPDQESTDFGKAVAFVRQHYRQPSEVNGNKSPRHRDIIAVGGLGGRVDQGVSQLHHLYLFQTDPGYAEGRMYLFSGESLTFLLKTGKHRIRVRNPPGPHGRREEDVFGKHVGILPLVGLCRITTRGLVYDVTDWETVIGGKLSTSNHVLPETEVIEVETTGDVLFTIALRQVGGQTC